MSKKGPRTQELIGQVALIVLEELNSEPYRFKSSEVKERLMHKHRDNQIKFDDEEFASGIHDTTGQQRWVTMLSFAVTTLKDIGFKTGPHGIWEITEQGKEFLKQRGDPKSKEEHLRNSYRKFRDTTLLRLRLKKGRMASTETTEEDIDSNFEAEIEDSQFKFNEDDARSTMFKYLEKLHWHEFQELVAHLFKGMDYTIDYTSDKGKDGGVDIVAHKGPLGGVDSQIIKVQVKHSENVESSGIPMSDIRQLRDLCGDDSVPVFVSLKGFSREAEKNVRTDSGKFMTLIDAVRFVDLWIDHIDTVPDEGKKLFPLKKVYVMDSE